MPSVSGSTHATAIKPSGRLASEKEIDGQTVADDDDWFVELVRSLYQHKAGTALHYLTGFEERTCQRYAAGHRKSPAYFFRALLRSEHGWQFLSGAMDGCKAHWLRDVQKAMRLKEAVDRAD